MYDSANCCEIPAYIFVAVLPCSLYGYAEAFPDMKSNHWIEAHVHAYSFFGGVTRILVPDNLKTGIYLLTLLTFPYFQGFPPLKILYMYPFPLFLPLWDNYKGKFIIQLFNRCLPLYQEVLRKSALLPL